MADPKRLHPTDSGPIHLADHNWFYVGGEYVERDGKSMLKGQMYVERYIRDVAEEQAQKFPVVMIHGGGQTGTNFTGTPDGRRGWLHDFLRAGYTVYIVDQPERGRSGHIAEEDGSYPLVHYDTLRTEQRFTAPEIHKLWPQSVRHTRWPGAGVKGNPIFDKFFASQVDMLASRDDCETLTRDAGVALLDEIGPAILLVHSQSGPFGWLIADARPNLVKGILSIEPNGPPFYEALLTGGEPWYAYEKSPSRLYGLTRAPLTYDPPITDPAQLKPVLEDADIPSGPDQLQCYQQSDPPRQLPNLQNIPILILVSEASYHATYDAGTSRFLTRAGVDHDVIALPDKGIHGNGHMVMCEANNHEIADVLIGWLGERARA